MKGLHLPAGHLRTDLFRAVNTRLCAISAYPGSASNTHIAHGSWPLALAWLVWCAFGISMIVEDSGGGPWMLWFAIGLAGLLGQSRNQVVVQGDQVVLRRGLTGERDRVIPVSEIADLWCVQGVVGKVFDCGRIGLRLRDHTLVWGPLIDEPLGAKHAIAEAMIGRPLVGLPAFEQTPFNRH